MKTIRSVIGETWVITDEDAMPEGGDRKFSLNDQMAEMIDKAQSSEKWANRLRTVGRAELTKEKDAIYVPDRKHFNWYRKVELADPDFTTNEDYYRGARLTYPDDKRLVIEEAVAEPGAHYGPYYICGKGADGHVGVVGYSEEIDDLPEILEKLKGTVLNPLPKFSTIDSTIYELCDGYKAETHVVENHGMDIWTASYKTTITNDQGLIVFSGYLTPEDIVGFRRSGDELRSMSEKTVSEYCPENVKKLNEIVMEFKTRDSFVPTDVQNLTSKLKELSVGDSLKLTCADHKTELLISCGVEIEWKDSVGREVRIPESPTKSDIKNLGLESVRLIHEKVYTAHAKDINGSSIESSPLHVLSFNKLFEMVSDTDKFRERFNDMQEWHSDVADMNCLGRSAIIQIFSDIHDINDAERPAPEYLVDKVIPIAALIKRARQEPTDTNESSGPGM